MNKDFFFLSLFIPVYQGELNFNPQPDTDEIADHK